MFRNQKGQVTIFFATATIVVITLMAFVINIGIFVKAKINLQNATDAAAYAGASVQARQLTSISYLNWEMRNVYKEWMFKYYVLGSLNLPEIAGTYPPPSFDRPSCVSSSPTLSKRSQPLQSSDFRMCSYNTTTDQSKMVADSYNFPSICIDFANTGSVGLCTRYAVPGLPRFKSSNVLGMDETTNAFIDAIVSQKNEDCSKRTQVNFYTANLWAYNVPGALGDTGNIAVNAPEIAADRVGAFPQAFELALRIRNLEAQVNALPNLKVCGPSSGHPECAQTLNDIIAQGQSPAHERIYKAYMSGFRNLGSQSDNEMRNSFMLTEISPTQYNDGNPFGLSNLLIPSGRTDKYYVDLKLMTLNYSTFYTAFTSTSVKDGQEINVNGARDIVSSEGQCTATKIGLPVPGYPLGYYKNPDVLTYYAVKGEAQFIGLFNPFNDLPINLTAYAAAKPFGGRIGPKLFANDGVAITARSSLKRSAPYMSTLKSLELLRPNGTKLNTSAGIYQANEYVSGLPLPLNVDSAQFWLEDSTELVGGYPGRSKDILFGIPNLAYDYPNAGAVTNRSSFANAQQAIEEINGADFDETSGLYNKEVLDKFKKNLRGLGGIVSTTDINNAIQLAKAPTLLDTHNYLIPTPEIVNKEQEVDSFGFIHGPSENEIQDGNGQKYQIFKHRIYAPLFSNSPDNLYNSESQIKKVLDDYLEAQKPAVRSYIAAMNVAAYNIYNLNDSTNTNQKLGVSASAGISDIDISLLDAPDVKAVKDTTKAKPSCLSITGKFAYYYLGDNGADLLKNGDTANCPKPMRELLVERWSSGAGFSQEDHLIEFALPSQDVLEQDKLFSAYRPGPEHDAEQGVQTLATGNRTFNMKRNFYSTKFVSLRSLVDSADESYAKGNPIYSEGAQTRNDPEIMQTNFQNVLRAFDVGLDLDKIKH